MHIVVKRIMYLFYTVNYDFKTSLSIMPSKYSSFVITKFYATRKLIFACDGLKCVSALV